MIVVAGGAENVKAVAFASERRFSARAAVRDVGFGELLGERNVDAGARTFTRAFCGGGAWTTPRSQNSRKRSRPVSTPS